ncbi:helicase-exonuclease AddAB subunit AddA [Bacillota bacterium LX-D]|nr:helicase-exonuclease AddAB subunit AddA [Bacillota bacterium LX-D]
MSERNWTKEQLEAICHRGSNLLVAAAAGSGKTAVLVERIIRLISQGPKPLNVDSLLVVTFTNAAAAEMRERIGQAIVVSLNKHPESAHLEKQLLLLNRAHITTLHSFCLELVRQNFYQLDLEPNFRIADEIEASLLRLEVLEEIMEKYYAEDEDGQFALLASCYGGERGDEGLQSMVLSLDDFLKSLPWPEKWLEQNVNCFKIDENMEFDELIWVKSIKKDITLKLTEAQGLLKSALKLTVKPGGPANYEASLKDDLVLVAELQSAAALKWGKMYEAFSSVTFKSLKRCGKDVDEGLKEQTKNLRNKAKKIIEDLRKNFFTREPQSLCQDLIDIEPLLQTLKQVVIDFQNLYGQKKRERLLVDFNDLEHYTLQLLLDPTSTVENIVPSKLALELRQQFAEILVDEYQDINGVQEAILQLICCQEAESNLFLVGDVKQSIYRFRQAEPGLFLQKYHEFILQENCARRIDLAKNFRSRREIVDGTNFIFRQIMTKEVGEMAYTSEAELVYGANYPEQEGNGSPGAIEVHLIDRKSPEISTNSEETRPDNEAEELDSIQLEARAVGNRIKEMIGKQEFAVYDQGLKDYRPLTYRDIVILLRSTQNKANIFAEEFRQLGIPVYAELGTGYLEAAEVATVLSLLKIIDNPRQDIPLTAVLRSPIGNFTAEELVEIRVSAKNEDFFTAVELKAQDTDPLGLKLHDFLAKLDLWRTFARQNTLADLIWNIYRTTNYYDYVGGMPGGAQRQANLKALYDRALQYEKTSFRGLFRFLRFIERLQERGKDLGAAGALGENEDVVRIMSIHKSKGLEFPVVIVANLGKEFNLQDLNKDLLLHKELGFGPAFVDPQLRIKYPTLARQSIAARLRMELLAEELRIFYVAMTRAKEKLLLFGSVADLSKALETWSQEIPAEGWALPEVKLATAKKCLDWLVPALMRHSNGDVLRQLAASQGPMTQECSQDPSCWKIVVWNRQDCGASAVPRTLDSKWEQIKDLKPLAIDNKHGEQIARCLDWVYPKEYAKIPAKLTVSDLKERLAAQKAAALDEEKIVFQDRPKFLQESKKLTGAERGTALHLLLQHLNKRLPFAEEKLPEFLAELQIKEILTKEQAAALNCRQIAMFYASPLGQRLQAAPQVQVEVPFSLMLPGAELYPELKESSETILLQGVIDCLWEENGEIVIVDYKTDWVVEAELDKLVTKYRIQLNAYARAVETIWRKKVKQKYLYFFELNKAVEI